MKQEKYFYERSNLLESEVNINFEDLLYMNEVETKEWIEKLRIFVLNPSKALTGARVSTHLLACRWE